jgi:hypothetical protein
MLARPKQLICPTGQEDSSDGTKDWVRQYRVGGNLETQVSFGHCTQIDIWQ